MHSKLLPTTKAFFLLCMLIPLAGIGQTKNLISTTRVFPKVDKVLEFEKALGSHAQKYHSGTSHWRVFAIQTGPDAGGYHITEGPTSWEAEDVRGNLGNEHNIDWNKNVAVYSTDRSSAGYAVYQDSLSTVALGDFSDKINISHIYPKIGHSDDVVNMIKRLKKTWTAAGVTVAVYAASSSGEAQYTLVTRYKQGLKERNPDFRKPFREMHDMVHGEGAYAQYLKDAAEHLNNSWSELLFLRPELSSK